MKINKMLRALKIRLYPNATQATQFNKLLGCYRFVYNKCLDKKINSYKDNQISENRTTLGHYIHQDLLKDDSIPWLREQNSKVLKQAVIDMLDAYKHFFEQHMGFPKFKSKHDNKQSCRFEIGAISKRNVYTDYKISLANIRNIKFRCSKKHAEYLQTHKQGIRSATLTRLPSGEYYLSILVDGELMKQIKASKNCIGIDLGVKDFVITSEGEYFENLHFKKSESNKIKRLQRQLSKKVKGSNNRNKARIRLAKEYKKITDRKQYYLHSVSNSLIDENQVICMEDLNVKGMLRNHKLAENIAEVSLGEFRRIMEYKCKWYGRQLLFVGRWYPSSKTCNHCGYIKKDLTLDDRVWMCPNCGREILRDENAAKNILDEALRFFGNSNNNCIFEDENKIGSSTTEFTLGDCPTMDDKTSNGMLKSSDRLNQEDYNERFVQV